MPTKSEAGMLHYDYSDPEDRAALIANGAIWGAGSHAVDLAVQDIAEGRVAAPANLPPEVARMVEAAKWQPTPPTPEPDVAPEPDAKPPA